MRAFVLAALASTVCGSALAQDVDDFNRVVVFGDSLTDAGTYGARFTTNPDLVATQLLAQQYGSSTLPALPLGLPANANAWIYGAGGVGVTSPRLGAGGLYVTQQVDAFLAASTPGPRDLILLQGGPNDVFIIAAGLTPGGEAAAQAAIEAEAMALTAQIDRLSGAGLILMLNMPNISVTPLGVLSGPAARQNFDLLISAFNTVLYDEVAARSGDILVLDTFGFIDAIVADPARFGFVNAASPACTVGSALGCTTATLIAPGVNEDYFFADGIHPTGAGHQAFADYAASVLDAPNQAARFGRALIGAADGDRAVAHAALDDARAGRAVLFGGLTGQSGDDADGFGVLIGLTRAAGEGGAYGALFSFETGEGDAPGLDHDTQSFRLTGFVGAPISDRFSVSGRLSGVYLNIDDVTRGFAVYRGSVSESGDTEAYGYAAAVRAAYDLSSGGALSHGLFAEISHESLDIDGYAEAGASPFALEFGDQEVRRTLGSIGYQIRYDGPGFAPFARAAYVETLDSDAGDVSVSLVNTPGVWSVNAPDFDDDGYAQLEAGFTTPAWPSARLMVVASGAFQDDHESARLLVGLTRAF